MAATPEVNGAQSAADQSLPNPDPSQHLGDGNISSETPLADESKTQTKRKMPTRDKQPPAKRTPRKSKWNAENILYDPASPLAKADLRSVLSTPMAWDVLGDAEKAEIIHLFPDMEHVKQAKEAGESEGGALLNFDTLLSDDNFRRDCASYTQGIADGKHDPDWLASAWSAHERRKMGDFDEHLVKEFENDWEVELPEDLKPKRMGDVVNGVSEQEVASQAEGTKTQTETAQEDEKTEETSVSTGADRTAGEEEEP